MRTKSLTLSILLALGVAPVALAQQSADTDTPQNDDKYNLGTVAVVGTRGKYRTVNDAPVPVDILEAEDLERTGATELGRAIQALAPSFNFSSSSISDGTDALRPATLRGLGPDQTLVLINGKRRHTSALIHVNTSVGRGTAGTDINAIPISAVERVEVLRDGAAAVYGSDAIAGVINIVLKSNPSDREVTTYWGQTYEGDGDTTVGNLNLGVPLGEDGVFHFTYEYRDRGNTNRAGLTGAVQYPLLDDGSFDPREYTFNRRNFRIGDADSRQNVVAMNSEISFGSGTWYAFATYSNRKNQSAGFYRRANQTNRTVLEIYPDGFLPLINTNIEDWNLNTGYKWSTEGGWDYDLHMGVGHNSFNFYISNSLNASFGPQSPTEADAGTLKLGLFQMTFDASRPVSIGGHDANFAWGLEYRRDKYKIVPGEPVSYEDGGAINPRTGEAYAPGFQVFRGFSPNNYVSEERNNKAFYVDLESNVTDQLLLTGALRHENYSDFGGTTIGKLGFKYDVNLNLAFRGAINTGFRAPSMQQLYFNSISTQFVSDPNNPGGGLIAQERGTFRNDSEIARLLGIPQLKEEESTNYSLGFVYTTPNDVTVSVDLYRIDIKDRIVISGAFSPSNAPAATAIFDQLNITAAQFFINAGDTTTQGVDVVVSKNGIAITDEWDWDTTFAANWTNTDVTVSVQAPDLLAGLEDVIFTSQDRSIIEEWQPNSHVSWTNVFSKGNWDITLRGNYYGEYTIQEGNGDRQTFSGKFLADLMFTYNFEDYPLTVSVGANNLFDTYPDKNRIGQARGGRIVDADGTVIVDSPGVFTYSRRAAPFGFNGGFYFVTANYRF